MKWRSLWFVSTLFPSLLSLFASPGDIDVTFNPGSGIDGGVTGIYRQPHGDKWVIIGGFTAVHGFERQNIARLNGDGSTDPTFDARLGPPTVNLSGVIFLPEGKMYVFGNFRHAEGIDRGGIARLNPDGTFDRTFLEGMSGADGWVHSALLLADGKILIGGSFSSVNDTPQRGTARLKDDGSLDTTYVSSSIDFGAVYTMASQSDGKVLLAGSFSRVQGMERRSFARVDASGLADFFYPYSSFEASSMPTVLIPLPGSQTLVGGSFWYIGGGSRFGLALLSSTARISSSFGTNTSGVTGDSGEPGTVNAILPQSDGSFIVAGLFSKANSLPRNGLAQFTSAGQVDPTFATNFISHRITGSPGGILAAAQDQNGGLAIAGTFARVNGNWRPGVAKLNSDASLDTTFSNGSHGLNAPVLAMATQPATGKILAAGPFYHHNDVPQKFVARLNLDGSLDTTFKNPLTNYSGHARTIAVTPNGKIYVGGGFDDPASVREGLARLSADGDFEAWVLPNLASSETVSALAIQPDGKIVVSTYPPPLHGQTMGRLRRLNADGNVDDGFSGAAPPNASVEQILIQPDGKIVIGGTLASETEPPTPFVRRVHSNGVLDSTFAQGLAGANDWVTDLALHDGKILVSGFFSTFHGQPVHGLAKLNLNGSVDTNFPGLTTGTKVAWIMPQLDGKILYCTGGQYVYPELARLNADGSPDATFRKTSAEISAGIIQADGRLILGGNFTSIQGLARDYVVRLFAADPPQINSLLPTGNGNIRLNATAPPGAAYIVEWSHDLLDGWVEFSRGATTDGSISVDISSNQVASEQSSFFRVVQP